MKVDKKKDEKKIGTIVKHLQRKLFFLLNALRSTTILKILRILLSILSVDPINQMMFSFQITNNEDFDVSCKAWKSIQLNWFSIQFIQFISL